MSGPVGLRPCLVVGRTLRVRAHAFVDSPVGIAEMQPDATAISFTSGRSGAGCSHSHLGSTRAAGLAIEVHNGLDPSRIQRAWFDRRARSSPSRHVAATGRLALGLRRPNPGSDRFLAIAIGDAFTDRAVWLRYHVADVVGLG